MFSDAEIEQIINGGATLYKQYVVLIQKPKNILQLPSRDGTLLQIWSSFRRYNH